MFEVMQGRKCIVLRAVDSEEVAVNMSMKCYTVSQKYHTPPAISEAIRYIRELAGDTILGKLYD